MATTHYNARSILTQLLQDEPTLNNPRVLVKVLRHIANRIEAAIPSATHAPEPFPKELDTPETAWPWLVTSKPWIFQGINLSTEPYYHYLKKAQPQQDALAIAHLDNPSQADVAEVLFDDRTKTGGSYRRRILAALAATTTADRPGQARKLVDIAA